MDMLQSECRNILIQRLGAEEFACIVGLLEPVELLHRDVLGTERMLIDYVYLPETGVASVTCGVDRKRIEIGMVGREGSVGLPASLGDGVENATSFVQVSGQFLRLPAPLFRSVVLGSPSALDLMLRYVQAYIVQIASTAVANGTEQVEQRLARWLLMVSDRLSASEIPLTHDLVASTLGVRRPGVTVATHVLEGEHAISAYRGRIRIVDRGKLIEIAGSSYGGAEREYERLIGEPIQARPASRV